MNPIRGENWDDIYFTSRDGLRLHVRHYAAGESSRVPVICLPGLTRNARDFHDIATALANPHGLARDVYAVDYRGRGHSDHDPNPANYNVHAEALDVLDFMTVRGIGKVSFLGTSRGGLITMAIAALRPTCMHAVILNDIGPVIEREGLVRIIAYVGAAPLPDTWEEAAELVRTMNQAHFPETPPHQWMEIARQIYNDDNGRPNPGYDRNLAKSLSLLDGPLPELWPQFDALAQVPVLVIRGQHSDLLSVETVAGMQARHSRLDAVTVRGQGHAPWLKDPWSMDVIAKFLERADVLPA